LREILAQRERGELKYLSLEEVMASTEATIAKWEHK